MTDLRDTTQVDKLPVELTEAGKAISKAINNALKVRVRVDDKNGFYLDVDTVVTCCFWDENSKKITIEGPKNLHLEFKYDKFELNNMSDTTHTKFYFCSKTGLTLGITVNY